MSTEALSKEAISKEALSTNTLPTDAPPGGSPLSDDAFDPSTRWECSSKIGLRPEPFGALAYHFDTRRLVFLKSPTLVELVNGLSDHDSAMAAIEAIVKPVDDRSLQAHVTALASLAEAGVIEPSSPTTDTQIVFVG